MIKRTILTSLLLFLMVSAHAQTTNTNSQSDNKTRSNQVSGQIQMMNPGRKVAYQPDWNTIIVNEPCKISLIVSVDASGKVVSAKTNTAKTTTSDPLIIEQVAAKAKQELIFEAKPSASVERVPYELSISVAE